MYIRTSSIARCRQIANMTSCEPSWARDTPMGACDLMNTYECMESNESAQFYLAIYVRDTSELSLVSPSKCRWTHHDSSRLITTLPSWCHEVAACIAMCIICAASEDWPRKQSSAMTMQCGHTMATLLWCGKCSSKVWGTDLCSCGIARERFVLKQAGCFQSSFWGEVLFELFEGKQGHVLMNAVLGHTISFPDALKLSQRNCPGHGVRAILCSSIAPRPIKEKRSGKCNWWKDFGNAFLGNQC